jgi:hypothetical protein
MATVARHPVRLVVRDDLERSRLTVFFRLLLAIPHFIWLLLWSVASFFVAVVNWFATLFTGRSPKGLHGFLSAYIRYATHLYAYLLLAANPYPGFAGDPGYPVDLEIDPPEPQSRWKTGFRLILALPALILAGTLIGSPGGGGGGGGGGENDAYYWAFGGGGIAFVIAFFGWFACLARGQMPQGFRDLVTYALRYDAQAYAYLLLLTDRYPDADVNEPRPPQSPPEHPVEIDVEDDGRRSRLTVFFRLLLFLPHYVWSSLWSYAVIVAAIASWFATLATGRSPQALHRFMAAFVRYQAHIYSFLFLVANPFPGFTGAPGRYPVNVEIAPPARQRRWKTLFRLILAIPALIVAVSLLFVLFVVAVFGWFVALALGRMPGGLRNLGAYVIRYWAQTYAYVYLLTDRYPFSGPLVAGETYPEPEPLVGEP